MHTWAKPKIKLEIKFDGAILFWPFLRLIYICFANVFIKIKFKYLFYFLRENLIWYTIFLLITNQIFNLISYQINTKNTAEYKWRSIVQPSKNISKSYLSVSLIWNLLVQLSLAGIMFNLMLTSKFVFNLPLFCH